MSREAADACRQAADAIQERGIAKGAYFEHTGEVCLYGALAVALTGAPRSLIGCTDPSLAEIKVALGKRFDADSAIPGAFEFNDLPDTTAEDVAKVLLQVADELEVG